MNRMLEGEISTEEVREAVFQMQPSKASGPDGMNPFFFQKFWNIVGEDITNAIKNFQASGKLLKQINFTYVSLIPKTKQPEEVTQFRPISLCNVLFRIISKVLANRLKVVIPKIISQTQSAFVPGRNISDNTILASEVANYLFRRRRGKKGFASLKLDISKAYDRIEWGFLHRILTKMGFSQTWIKLIMLCVTTVSYSVLVNGCPRGYILPSRGLRQGDPLSPYLFILCAEGLSALIALRERRGLINGISICPEAPSISHLLFADDSLLFCRATESDCRQIREVLKVYERASGQKVNLEKSEACFSRNVKRPAQMKLAEIFGVNRVDRHDKYLGMPTFVGRNKSLCFGNLKDRLWKRLKSWKGKLLSAAGKEVLVKAVAQAIPNYSMICFLLPKLFCDELNRMVASYWWSGDEGEKKMHWCSWERLCNPKMEGGLGFRFLYAFNLGMLAKQGWRLLSNPQSLVATVLKAKYFPTSSFMEAPLKPGASYVWKSIYTARNVLSLGLRWQVGTGHSIRIWEDPWIPIPLRFRPYSPKPVGCTLTMVNELIDHVAKCWKIDVLQSLFSAEEVNLIRKIPLSVRNSPDHLLWHHERHGRFTVRSAYHVARNWLQPTNCGASSSNGDGAKVWAKVWNAQVPTKVKICVWRLANELVPTRANLVARHITMDVECVLCGAYGESTIHLMKDCHYARCAWMSSHVGTLVRNNHPPSFMIWINEVADRLPKASFDIFMMVCWALWRARNMKLWEEKLEPPEVCTDRAIQWWLEFARTTNTGSERDCRLRNTPRWSVPPQGRIKMNIDGSWNAGRLIAGFGAIIRDSDGSFVAAHAGRFEDISSPLLSEAMAVRAGLLWAIDRGYQSLIIETDSLQIVEALRDPTLNLSTIGQVVEDCKALLNTITEANITHIRRNANAAAHHLAKVGLSLMQSCEWTDSPPSIITDILVDDYASSMLRDG
ncbi:hypothetical protein ACFX15_009620 [Malus domestica]